MTTPGRGRGYTGRYLREPRPGDVSHSEDDAVRTLAELSPRSTAPKYKIKSHCCNEKETVPPAAPEPITRETEDKTEEVVEDEGMKDLLTIDEQYAPLLALLEQFSIGEDGIQFNRKLKHFESTVTNMCPDEFRLQQAFATFRAASLLSSVTARKLASVGASFTRQQRQQLLRATLLNVVMQGTYSKLELLERVNPMFLVNAANLMGDYFAEARLCNGNKVHILASPLLQYMKALLTSDDLKAHRSLATQLMQNGRELLAVLPQEIEDLSISIRYRLLKPPPNSIIWLLLSADLCLNKFLPLPNTLQQFYASHLDLTPDENFSEVSYGSWKRVEKDDNINVSEVDRVGSSLSNVNLSHDEGKPKLRPILGAGAGLLRQEQALSISQDSFETWSAKNSLSKRYDLNSWRQNEKKEEEYYADYNRSFQEYYPSSEGKKENFQNYPQVDGKMENYPNYSQSEGKKEHFSSYSQSDTRLDNFSSYPHSEKKESFSNYPPNDGKKENFPTYLQQGDGKYIQSYEYRPEERDAKEVLEKERDVKNEQPPLPEKVNNEMQKSRRVENWRREKNDLKEDGRRRNWTRQRSRDNLEEDKRGGRFDSELSRTPPKRHVSDVPRSHKYWDHDDRCDKDYNS